jgi:signal transduction histidine kinase
VHVAPGDAVVIRADGDQLDQVLINLVRNAVEASIETGGGVRVYWMERDDHLLVFCEDEGVGLPPTTTRPAMRRPFRPCCVVRPWSVIHATGSPP